MKKVFLLIILVIFMYDLNLATKKGKSERKNLGKVFGQIIDPETGNPVNAIFHIFITNCNESYGLLRGGYLFHEYANENGNFSFELEEGTYCLQFFPYQVVNAKYAFDPEPNWEPNSIQRIIVKKGKATRVIKKAQLSGTLKILLVDVNGNKINVKERFGEEGNANIILSYLNEELIGLESQINEGERIYSFLFPHEYEMRIEFSKMGYGKNIFIDKIKVEQGKTTEIKVIINPTDNTGIMGCIKDKSNKPIKNIYVYVEDAENKKNVVDAVTDLNGNYKIIGLEEREYILYVEYEDQTLSYLDGRIKSKEICRIWIKKGFILKQDIVLGEI